FRVGGGQRVERFGVLVFQRLADRLRLEHGEGTAAAARVCVGRQAPGLATGGGWPLGEAAQRLAVAFARFAGAALGPKGPRQVEGGRGVGPPILLALGQCGTELLFGLAGLVLERESEAREALRRDRGGIKPRRFDGLFPRFGKLAAMQKGGGV